MSNSSNGGGEQRKQPAARKRLSGFSVVLLVIALVALAFGSGALWIHLRTRGVQAALVQENSDLQQRIDSQAQELVNARTREALWSLREGVSGLLVDLSEKNFGLASDRAVRLQASLGEIEEQLNEQSKAMLASVGQMLEEIARHANSLSSVAKEKSQEALSTLSALISGLESESFQR